MLTDENGNCLDLNMFVSRIADGATCLNSEARAAANLTCNV